MNTEERAAARKWWRSKRCKYNKGLLISGSIAFVLYCTLGEFIIAPHEEFEETLVEIIFQGVAYCLMILLANGIYSFGWVIDMILNKDNNQSFRERLFKLGYWLSFALPILLILSVMVRFAIFGE